MSASPIAITGLGLACPVGSEPMAALTALQTGQSGLVAHPPLHALPGTRAGVVERPGFRPYLRRRKDAKLMTRAARLALAAAGDALQGWTGDRMSLGVYLGVGREPPDDGEAELALAVSCRDGQLDEALLAGPGRDRYPPLLPLKTLPNMALAHISIHLGIGGDNGAWAGGPEAGRCALEEACWAIREGRASAALAGGADSLVDLGSARDRLRMGEEGAPGEGAALFLLEPLVKAKARNAQIWGVVFDGWEQTSSQLPLRDLLGGCGAAEGALDVMMAILAESNVGAGQRMSMSGEQP